MHQGNAIGINLPLEDGEVKFDRTRIGEHCRQATAEGAQMFMLAQNTTLGIIERRNDAMAINGDA
jgi:hypothetical protein